MKMLSSFANALKEHGFLVNELTNDVPVEFVSYTSRNIKPNTLFICKGAGFKEEYLINAIKDGVTCYVSEKQYNVDIPCLLVSDVISAMSLVAAHWYDYPQNE
ncbi:MAG: UDP-N-acetylmuramoyl-L-alanyl-D-glutamate--2,6-diaminopimelate ligase, partial [Clostridia bacterium]|nr:UDP-N-acetylmuramoyl-L-alanyl-D-glutamate--2,6-diaminopimelate ligase [Clostridia bacterium]